MSISKPTKEERIQTVIFMVILTIIILAYLTATGKLDYTPPEEKFQTQPPAAAAE